MTEINNNEIITKEEFNKRINEFEEKLMIMLDVKESQIQKEIKDIKENSSDVLQKSKMLIENYSKEKMYDTKISELESFKNKVNDMLITHEIRINNNIKDISNFTTKYEKIISENIFVPGFVGPSCQYRTLSEYINFNINEVTKLRQEKDSVKKDQKEFKAKMDNFMKQMLLLNDSVVAQSREYTNSKHKDIEPMIEGKLQPFNDKIFKFYESSLKFQSKVEKEINNFRKDLERILKIKEELIEIIKEKENKIKLDLENLNKKVIMNIQDIGINKNKIAEIKNEINEINNNYSKLNSDITGINKEINNINSMNNINKPNQVNKKNLRHSVANFNSFMNKLDKLDKNNISPIIFSKNKNNLYNTTSNLTEREEKDEEEKSEKKIDSKNNQDKENNNETIEENKNDNDNKKDDIKNLDERIKAKLIRNKLDNKNNIEKTKYKTLYNKLTKEIDEDTIFETFSLGNSKIPIITKPFLLDQRILSDEEMNRIHKAKKKEKLKIEKIRKNFLNNELNIKTNKTNNNNPHNNNNNNIQRKNLDLNYYKLSIPKLNFNQKSEEKLFNLTNYDKKRMKNINKDLKSKSPQSTKKIHYKIKQNPNNYLKYLNLVNLKLDGSVAINPETNNGAYVLAQKQLENNKISKLNITPTSYFYKNDFANGGKTSKLVSMTFMHEEQKMLNSFNNTLGNLNNGLKLELSDLYKDFKFFKEN